jgi:hypothetical protein
LERAVSSFERGNNKYSDLELVCHNVIPSGVSLPNQSTFTKSPPKRLISSDDEDSEVPAVAFLNPTPRLSGDKMKVETWGCNRLKFTR